MRVDDSRHLELLGNGVQQVINHQTGLGVQSAIRLIAEQVFGIECNGSGDGYAFLHTSRYLAGELLFCSYEVDTVQTIHRTFLTFA